MLLLEVVEPVAFDAPHLSHPPLPFQLEAWQALVFRQVESSLSRRRDFDITAWVAAALPAAAARLRYVRNLWQRAAVQKNGISIFGTRGTHTNIKM